MNSPNLYCTPYDIGQLFPGLTADRLARWRWAKRGPSYSKVGRQIFYLPADVESYLRSHRVEAGGEQP